MPFDGTTYKPLLAVLAEGRRRVETSWWQKTADAPMPPLDSHCTTIAITRQNAGDDLTKAAVEVLAFAIFGNPKAAIGIVPWNDAPGRTKEEVLAAYDRAMALVSQ